MAVETALVIDDSKSARVMLSRLVQKNGLEVNMVESGEEALSYLETSPLPDVIFMDHMMPGMDGLQTTKAITTNPLTKHIPIFMYTSKEGPDYEAEVCASGAYGMLGKPAKPERLKQVIAELNEELNEALTNKVEPEVAEETISEVPVTETVVSDEPLTEQIITQETIEPKTIEPEIQIEKVEEEEMSQEMIEEVASKLIARAIEDALQPISSAIQRLETSTHENQSEIRKLSSRMDQNHNMVTQSVLDASLKQTTAQFQSQLSTEIKSIRDLLEQRAELSPATLQTIKDLASKNGSEAGLHIAEKTATSAAEAVAAKVSAAQTQIQVQQNMAPFIQQAKKANLVAIVALLAAGTAIALPFLL